MAVCNTLIHQYQNWKGINHVPGKTDKSLRWSAKDPLPLLPVVNDSPWQLITKSKAKKESKSKINQITSSYLPAKGSTMISYAKRKHSDHEFDKVSTKKVKLSNYAVSDEVAPLGLRWDAVNHSCAYDSLFVILYHIWIQDPDNWTLNFQLLGNEFLNTLIDGFQNVSHKTSSMEMSRDVVRQKLHAAFPSFFPFGPVGTSVNRLACTLLETSHLIAYSQKICIKCKSRQPEVEDRLGYVLDLGLSTISSTSQWLKQLQYKSKERCAKCSSRIVQPISYDTPPKLLIFDCGNVNLDISHRIVYDENDRSTDLQLRGIVYSGQFHFNSRIISQAGNVWFHDGMITGQNCVEDEHIKLISKEDINRFNDKQAVLAVYAQV